MKKDNLILEISKKGNYTCKYQIEGVWKYLYSRYEPEKFTNQFIIKQNAEFIVVLGLGLGYELREIYNQTNKPIYLIEQDRSFYETIQEIFPGSIEEMSNVSLFFNEEYKKMEIDINDVQIIINNNLIQCNIEFYKNVISYIHSGSGKTESKLICMVDHPTILDDCMEAFQEIGYSVVKLNWENESIMLKKIAAIDPTYLFTINFSEKVSNISKTLHIPYISWTVDTPAYSLYNSKNLYNNLTYYFIYDQEVVSDLKKQGLKRAYYLPVAANVKRLSSIEVSASDYTKYSSQVTFVGSSGAKNEFLESISPKIPLNLRNKINEIVQKQFSEDLYILKDLVDVDLVREIQFHSNYSINNLHHSLLSKEDKLAFLLGRYQSYLERTQIINQIAKTFKVNIYGDNSWDLTDDKLFGTYNGFAEHFIEMPKIFKVTKINLNITRKFVTSGLPMRIFDVLGSGGFLVTNYKSDITKLFKDGSDLVVYRDLQDLMDIIRYYLENEEERDRIRMQGYEAMKKEHTYIKRITKMMDIINGFKNE
ncbi:spore maturation protein CgeB [Metabacillus crassostreae]|uniref:CgeB family protein n=1 Tax=Metabacillus crassostreae TaxID=929098 RepID=UPI00195DA481|nr:glycosyltransferase [Metabacillus crassostreae]MBM7606234.1 spore maturation protein CgeB [Metabacillus crassostreae]